MNDSPLTPIPEWEGLYSITESGQVWSHLTNSWRAHGVDRLGYHQITLHGKEKPYTVFIHQLVLRTYKGPPPSALYMGSHEDDNKDHNDLSNLHWRTDRENKDLSVANGRHHRGEQIHTARLTEADVISIRQRFAGGATANSLAQELGLPIPTVDDAITGRSWKHLPILTRPSKGFKLTKEDIQEIKRLRGQGVKLAILAERFSVTIAAISHASRR